MDHCGLWQDVSTPSAYLRCLKHPLKRLLLAGSIEQWTEQSSNKDTTEVEAVVGTKVRKGEGGLVGTKWSVKKGREDTWWREA